MDTSVIHFLAGGLTACYLLATVFFFRFWRTTRDRLFFSFALAFVLLAIEQIVRLVLGVAFERGNYVYILRIIAFLIILYAIIDKNLFVGRRKPRS
jgi:hypothetical protein